MQDATRSAAPSPVKLALLKIRSLREELAQARAPGSEPIAVIGLGCRFPGGADSPERLWRLLESGTDAITEAPPERWLEALYDPEPGKPGRTY